MTGSHHSPRRRWVSICCDRSRSAAPTGWRGWYAPQLPPARRRASPSSGESSPTPAFASAFATGFWRRFRHAEIVTARYEPVYGALLLAYREHAVSVTELRE